MKTITLYNGQLKFHAYHYGDHRQSRGMVLCLHGFPDNAHSFRYQIDDFLEAGFQVLSVTMRGYEPSSIPADNDFSLPALAGDVITWLDQLKTQRLHLVGHDWGSSVAYLVASMAPEHLLSLSTLAVPHPQRFSREGIRKVPAQAIKSWYMAFNQIPGLSDYVVRANDFSFLRFLWRKWSPNQVLSDAEWRSLATTFSQSGVVKAMLSYYRQNVSARQLLGLKKSAINTPFKIPVPNLAITGADDGCIDTRVFDYTILPQDHPCGFRLERIAGAGHFAHQEKPAIVNKLLIDWFNSNSTNSVGESHK